MTQLIAPAGVTLFEGRSGQNYSVDGNGIVNITLAGDVGGAFNAGFVPAMSWGGIQSYAAPAAANATLVVHASTLANSTLVVSAQPTLARKLSTVVSVAGGSITAGNLTLVGVSGLQAPVTEVQSVALGTATATTIKSSNAFAAVNTAILTGVGGATVTASITIGTAPDLAIIMPTNFRKLAVVSEFVDGATESIGTVDGVAGCIALTTAPNGTHNYSLYYTFVQPAG